MHTYIDADQSYHGYDIKTRRMKNWIREYEVKLDVVEWANVSAEEILAIKPKTKVSKIEALKEIIRALGMNPEQILTKEALT